MAFQAAKTAVFKLDTAGGVLTDLSAYITNIALPFDVDMLETTTFGKSARTFMPGLRNATISISGKFDPVLDAHLIALLPLSASSTFEYAPMGTGTGNRRYTGECFLVKYEPPSQVDGLVEFSAELQVTDAITINVY